MSATLINKGLQVNSIGGLSGVRFFFTRSARTLLDSLSSIQKVELSSDFFGAPGGVRIPNLWFRRPTLYPIELVAHNALGFPIAFIIVVPFAEKVKVFTHIFSFV